MSETNGTEPVLPSIDDIGLSIVGSMVVNVMNMLGQYTQQHLLTTAKLAETAATNAKDVNEESLDALLVAVQETAEKFVADPGSLEPGEAGVALQRLMGAMGAIGAQVQMQLAMPLPKLLTPQAHHALLVNEKVRDLPRTLPKRGERGRG